MKITIEVSDITQTAIALNNAMVAYGDIISCIELGLPVMEKFRVLEDVDDKVLRNRFECLRNMYKQIEALEGK